MPPTLTITPDPAPLDRPLDIVARGFAAGAPVTLHARSTDRWGRTWASRAGFRADAEGAVRVAEATARSGSYRGVDPMGLVWSMKSQPRRQGGQPTNADALEVVAESAMGQACARVDRYWLGEADLIRSVVRAHGLAGVLFTPRASGTFPAVILVGGAEGGLHELDAALLAGHGFVVLALAYFGSRGLPRDLARIPLEYFQTAARFLLSRRKVHGDQVGIVGGSRGGEAALLAAATWPQFGAAVSYVGSGVMTEGIGPGRHVLDKIGLPIPSWTINGIDLPYLPARVTDAAIASAQTGRFELGLAFATSLDDKDRLAEASIPVERIAGGVLLITAGGDRCWPCTALSDIAEQRRRAHGLPVTRLHYPDAGHLITTPPYGPTTVTTTPGPGVRFVTGGTAAANAAARADSWPRTVDFLRSHLTHKL